MVTKCLSGGTVDVTFGPCATGIYVTPHSQYAATYSQNPRGGQWPMVLCLVVVGSVYPVSRKSDYAYPSIYNASSVSKFHFYHPIPFDDERAQFTNERRVRVDKGMQAGYDCHFVSVSKKIKYQAADPPMKYTYDEVRITVFPILSSIQVQ